MKDILVFHHIMPPINDVYILLRKGFRNWFFTCYSLNDILEKYSKHSRIKMFKFVKIIIRHDQIHGSC